MEWSKVKNILIFILLGLNAILLVLVSRQEHQFVAYQETARTEILTTMASNGVRLPADLLPEDAALPTLKLELEDMQIPTRQAEDLLGPCQREDESAGVRVTYRGELGRMDAFNNGRFTVDLDPAAYPLGDKPIAEHALSVLSLLDCEAELADQRREGDLLLLRFRQRLHGAPVFNCEIVFTYRDGALLHIEGQRMLGPAAASAEAKPLSVPTLLLRLLSLRNESGQMFSEITGITAGYHLSPARPFTLTPVWYIETNIGAYTLKAADGSPLL